MTVKSSVSDGRTPDSIVSVGSMSAFESLPASNSPPATIDVTVVGSGLYKSENIIDRFKELENQK